MCPQSLGLRKRLYGWSVGSEPCRRIRDHTRPLYKVVNAKWIREGRSAPGGKRVVWPCDVVAQRLGRPRPHKYGTGILDGAQELKRIFAVQLQMLGRNNVDGVNGSLERGRNHHYPIVAKAGSSNIFARALPNERLHGRKHALGQLLAARYQVAGSHGVVLCLCHEIGSHHRRIGGGIGKHAHLGRPSHHIDAHVARNVALGRGNIGVARPHDFGHGRNRLGAIGHGAYGLSSPHRIDLIHARNRGGSQRIGRKRSVPLRRRNHNDARNPRNLGWHRVHKHRRGILGTSTGHIHRHAGYRRHLNAKYGSIRAGGKPRLFDFASVKVANLRVRMLKRIQKGGVNHAQRTLNHLVWHPKRIWARAIKAQAIFPHCLVAPCANILNNCRRRFRNVAWQGTGPLQIGCRKTPVAF